MPTREEQIQIIDGVIKTLQRKIEKLRAPILINGDAYKASGLDYIGKGSGHKRGKRQPIKIIVVEKL